MPLSPAATPIDPLGAFLAGAFIAGTRHPVPLIATRFDVAIASGVAVVTTTRSFRNTESHSIEATITFPVPVHAVLFRLEARIDGRAVTARAQRRQQARETYEGAIARGKSAVLHEEVLRGVHMLSVAHIAPGADIEVIAAWTITLTHADDRASLRIPLTVGDIYGRSGLPDSDELIHGAPVQTAELAVACRDGEVTLAGGRIADGKAQVRLDAPIDLEVRGFISADLHGRAADGRDVTLRVEPSRIADAVLDIAAMIDHSGSMGSACSDDRPDLTKHGAVVTGLAAAADRLGSADHVDLWEFCDVPVHVGSASGAADVRALVPRLTAPRGGTEIGLALATVAATSAARDVLLVTDGKSHALDVQALARTGRRFTVVLVGADSLEANVGHLAALTSGEIFVAADADLAGIVGAALGSLRAPRIAMVPVSGQPDRVAAARAGMRIAATWQATAVPAGPATEDATMARAVAALAASLALPALDTEAAAALAEAEGLVTHLTSLVLVDEAGAIQEGIPATRKIALPTPRTVTAQRALAAMPVPAAPARPAASMEAPEARPAAEAMAAPPTGSGRLRWFHIGGTGGGPRFAAEAPPRRAAAVDAVASSPVPPSRSSTIAAIGMRIDWDQAPQRLSAGDLSGLDPAVAKAIRRAAGTAGIRNLAAQLGLNPVVLVIALLARAAAPGSRSAGRIAKTILGGRQSRDADLDAAASLAQA